MDISSLQWLVGDRIESSKYDSNSQAWLITFQSGATLNIECIWRLLEEGVICSSSEDHGNQFGLAKPFNGEAALTEMGQHEIKSVTVTPDVGDITITFGSLFILQVIVTSAGYEAWQAKHSNGQSVVAGSGQLNVF